MFKLWCSVASAVGPILLHSQLLPMNPSMKSTLAGCPRRPINPIIEIFVLYLSNILVNVDFVLYFLEKRPINSIILGFCPIFVSQTLVERAN